MLKKLQKYTRDYQSARVGHTTGSWQDMPSTKAGRGACLGDTASPISNPAGFAAAPLLAPGGPCVPSIFNR